MNSVAARRSERRLYVVYLERVIKIEAVQCHREPSPTTIYAAGSSPGLPPRTIGDFLWSLDAPEGFPLGPGRLGQLNPVSLPMQLAWNAAVAAFKEFIAAIVNGELIANGVHPATGIRHDLDPAEWTRTKPDPRCAQRRLD